MVNPPRDFVDFDLNLSDQKTPTAKGKLQLPKTPSSEECFVAHGKSQGPHKAVTNARNVDRLPLTV
jgi:hypothetical protein